METTTSKVRKASRKGKKQWRKNVDISHVEEGLQKARDETIKIGTSLSDVSADRLFAVDTTASASALRKVGKVLKVDEILAQRSAIPAVSSRKRAALEEQAQLKKKGKVQGVTYKELGRLLRVARRQADGKPSIASIEAESRVIKDIYDPWDSVASSTIEISTRESNSLLKNADKIELSKTTSFTRPQKAPNTITRAPLTFKESRKAINVPEDGKSYNPSLESWQSLLAKENVALVKAEKERKIEQERLERIAQLGELLDERERLGLDEADSDEEEVEEKKVEVKKEEDLENSAAPSAPSAPTGNVVSAEKKLKKVTEVINLAKPKRARKHKLGKYRVMDRPIEVKLSDELTDSLRLLKPEGNIAKDRFISLQERGIIESRVQVIKGRKYKKHVTEKWSYKDIK